MYINEYFYWGTQVKNVSSKTRRIDIAGRLKSLHNVLKVKNIILVKFDFII